MPTQKRLGFFAVQLLSLSILTACGGGGSTTPSASSIATVSGSAQKGPFIAGSVVTAYQLGENGEPSGGTVSGVTTAGGNFITPELGWTGWTEIEVNGQYIDETKSQTPAAQLGAAIKLTALVNVTSETSFSTNINLATHLQAARTKALITSGMPIDTANTQALSEVQAEFDLTSKPSTLDLTKSGGDNEGLLLFSGALLSQAAPLTTPTATGLIDTLTIDFSNDAIFNNTTNSSDVVTNVNTNAIDDVETISQLADDIVATASIPALLAALQQNLGISVTGNRAPTFTSSDSTSISENTTAVTTVVATDPDGDSITLAISGGADADKFELVAGGQLSFKVAPDFEAPSSAANSNVYTLEVTATDSGNGSLTTTQTITVTVTGVNDNQAPTITSANAVEIDENKTVVTTVTATDPDANDSLTYAITGSAADNDKFTISSDTGELSFKVAPDFEAKGSTAANNTYEVEVTATDSASSTAKQTITITVNDILAIDGGFFHINRQDAAIGKVIGTINVTDPIAADATDITRTLVDFDGIESEFIRINADNEVVVKSALSSTLIGESLTAEYSTTAGDKSNKPAVGYDVYIDFKGKTPEVLPLGDSITFGEGSASIDGNPPAFPLQASYRAKLKTLFAADDAGEDNLKLDFIGTLTSTSNLSPNFVDNQHEGWGGRKITDIISEGIVTNSLTNAGIPDIVLIHLGTNDLLDTTAGDEETPPTYEFPTQMTGLTTIIETIRAQNPNVVIFLAQIIGMNKDLLAESFFADRVSTVDDINTRRLPKFNERIAELANTLNTEISPVIVVDQLTGYGTRRPATETDVDSVDGIHPNSKGETKIAQKWFDALQPFFNGVKE